MVTNMKLVVFKNNFQILLPYIQMRSEQLEVSVLVGEKKWLVIVGS